MEAVHFDNLARSLQRLTPRRVALGVLGGGLLRLSAALPLTGVVGTLLDQEGEARRGRNRRRRRKARRHRRDRTRRKVKFNAFGCVNVGDFCQTDEQCCSGRCFGRLGASPRCQAHDAGTGCVAGDCGTSKECTTAIGESGSCATTTGNAPYCYHSFGFCTACNKDADCTPICGPQAACIQCPSGDEVCGITLCVGPGGPCGFPP